MREKIEKSLCWRLGADVSSPSLSLASFAARAQHWHRCDTTHCLARTSVIGHWPKQCKDLGAIWLRRNWERIQRRPTKSDRVRSVSWYLLFALTRLWCVQTRQEDLNNVCNQPTNENAGSQLLASHWLVGSHDSSDQLLGNVTTWWHHTQITSSARTTNILTTDIDFHNAFFNLRNCI